MFPTRYNNVSVWTDRTKVIGPILNFILNKLLSCRSFVSLAPTNNVSRLKIVHNGEIEEREKRIKSAIPFFGRIVLCDERNGQVCGSATKFFQFLFKLVVPETGNIVKSGNVKVNICCCIDYLVNIEIFCREMTDTTLMRHETPFSSRHNGNAVSG
mmetsp:Transcript_61363/g.178016  ORF Transcript_61363/g.178016 Transcript_61363/m.178016 type:complete len:156 (+) Transcript_61363:1485-1952(+)